MHEKIQPNEHYSDRIDNFKSICNSLLSEIEDPEDFKLGYFRYKDTGVCVMADINPAESGHDCTVEVYGNPQKHEGDWSLPVTTYRLNAAGEFTRSTRLEKDVNMIRILLSPRLNDLIDIPVVEVKKIPDELKEIVNRDFKSLLNRTDPKDLLESLFGSFLSEKSQVSEEEFDALLEILRIIQSNPESLSF